MEAFESLRYVLSMKSFVIRNFHISSIFRTAKNNDETVQNTDFSNLPPESVNSPPADEYVTFGLNLT